MTVRTFSALAAAGALFVGAAAMPASAQWQNRLVDEDTSVNTIDDINEAEAILAAPGARPVTTNTSDIIDFPSTAPAGFGGEDFATESFGLVDIIGGTTGTFTLYVNGDDGFRLRRNGTLVGEFVGPTGSSNTTMPNVTLSDGDVLQLTFFERGGGEYNRFRINDDSGAFVGSTASGIDILPVPEPAALGVLAMGGLGLLARRRRRRA